MINNIQEILDMLHISVIGEKIDRHHYMIRENYQVPKYVAISYEECCAIVTDYYQYHFSTWMNFPTLIPEDIAFTRAKIILDKGQGGFVTAIKNALWGREGGLVKLIDTIADAFREEATEQYVTYILTAYVNPLDYGLKVQFMQQYLEQYAIPVLPEERLMSPYELAANFEAVVKYHLQWINSLRKVIQ